MLLRHRQAFASLIHGTDLAVLCGSALWATWAAGATPSPGMLALDCVVAATVWTATQGRLALYESRRTSGAAEELLLIVQGALLAFGSVLLLRSVLEANVPMAAGFGIGIATLAMGGVRICLRAALAGARRRGFNTRTVLFVGRGNTARGIALDYQRHPSWGIKILGQLTFSGEDSAPALAGVTQLGTVADLPAIIRANPVDDLVLCPSDGTWAAEVKSVVRFCQGSGLGCRIAPDLLGIPLDRIAISMTGDVPMYALRSGFGENRGLGIKRAIDVLGASAALATLAPVLALIALAIKITSKGPVLFAQQRLGLNARPFKLLKFRSMVPNAEQLKAQLAAQNEQAGPAFKMRHDPRVTPLGRWLRRYSLDELPQLLNVLVGHMSLVGPRPPLPSEVVHYDWWQRRRLSVRPGLTCIWQVSGRNTVSFDRWMEMDMQYIDGWSLAMDLKIIAKTVKEVLSGGGA